MKRIVIAAAVALAIPAFAADEAKQAPVQPQAAEQAAPAPEKPAKEQIASQGISKEVTLEAAPRAKSVEKSSLRFERWTLQGEDEPFETQDEWNAHRK